VSSLEILFEDNHCLVVNKPPGLPTQAPAHVPDSAESYARGLLMIRKGKTDGRVYLGTPHRLDRPASGILLFAKSSKAAARIAEQFRDHSVRKTYWAIVSNSDQLPQKGQTVSWTDWLIKLENQAKGAIAEADTPGAKEGKSEVLLLAREADYSHLQLHPATGRMHQLRLQCSSRGMPILGDLTYGSPFGLGNPTGLPLIALHARSLEFAHPIRYEPIKVEAPVPDVWDRFPISADIRQSCRISNPFAP